MPTAEEIAAFKRAFKVAAETANSSVRWDPPTGRFARWKTQTSLAPIMGQLTALEADPSLANIDATLRVINALPDDKDGKYEDAVVELWNNLIDARDEIIAAQNLAAGNAALQAAEFDDTAVAAPEILTHFAGWKRQRQVEVADGGSVMSFDRNERGLGGVDYWKGNVPSTTGEASCRGVRVQDLPPNEQVLVQTAKDAIANIRGALTKGAFNNHRGLPDDIRAAQCVPDDVLATMGPRGVELAGTPAPAWWNSVVEAAALIASQQYAARNRDRDVNAYKLQMACLARATKEVGGGVCSKMATATTGELTSSLPPGSEIAQVFHSFDHEFVIARVPGSRWFVVDPWCHTPMVVPFSDCSFDPTGVKNFIIIKVVEETDHAYGIDLDDGLNWTAIINQAKRETPVVTLEMKGVYGHADNVAGKGDFDPSLAGASNWG